MTGQDESKLDAELKDEFITEIKDDLERLESDLLIMEQDISGTEKEVVNSAFRAIHSIKGGAGFCGLHDLGNLSHSIENVLMKIREEKIDIRSDIIDALLAGLDKIKLMVENIDSDKIIPFEDENRKLEKIISDEETFVQKKLQKSESELSVNTDSTGAMGAVSLNGKIINIKLSEFKKAVEEGKSIYGVVIQADDDLIKKQRTALEIINDIKDSSDILFTDILPDMNEPDLKGKIFHVVLATILDTDFLAEVLEISKEKIMPLTYEELDFSIPDIQRTKSRQPKSSAPGKTEVKKYPPKERNIPADKAETDIITKGKSGEKEKLSENIRINTKLITKLMNLAGELVLTRNQLHPIMETYFKENKSDAMIMQNLDRVTSEMQEYIMQMRMQPVGKLFGRFQRIIRDTAKKLNKKVNYAMEGGDVELDRTIIEGLANPLIHLLRNCLDHGIESPEERIKAGKPEAGTIMMTAAHQGGHIYINIQDDGKGIDPEKIALHAVEKGIITKEAMQSMPDREKINIIFTPGFSTSEKITDISGRGVGMDVVKTNINELRGNIEIESNPGQGTNIQIIIPLTLAIISVLIVGTGDHKFAIPQLNIGEIVFIGPGNMQNIVKKIGDAEVIRLRESLLPIIRLRTLLGIDSFYTSPDGTKKNIERRKALADRRNFNNSNSANNNDAKDFERRNTKTDRRKTKWDGNYVIVLKMGTHKFGLCVETIFDNEEIVVNPLSDYIKNCRWFSGSTILGDGKIVMILDVSGIAKHASLDFDSVNDENRTNNKKRADLKKNALYNKSVLIFSCTNNEYFALPLDKLSRLEIISPDDIVKTGDYKFMNYNGTALSLFYLEELLRESPENNGKCNYECQDKKEIYVIIPKGLSFDAGIIIPCIVDTMQVPEKIHQNGNFPAAIKGTALIDNKMIQFLDYEIICNLLETKK